ncbi:hypothetical protein [Paraburkholderia caballeronis]|uniref:hypothetical protein n=1 Tax=Paraburkholderia caballeronis TaxID=416943 RepID=UPI001AB05120|nr:hypothetical protein [Paraburkholderia caballeronis]
MTFLHVALNGDRRRRSCIGASGRRFDPRPVHHGYDGSCRAVNRRALALGHGIRTGMENVTARPDGRAAREQCRTGRSRQIVDRESRLA